MSKLLLAVVAVLLAFWVNAPAFAQDCSNSIKPPSLRTPTPSEANQDGLSPETNRYLDQIADSARATLTILRCEIRPHLTIEQRKIFDQVDIYVNRKSWQVDGLQASYSSDTGRRYIIFPIGFIMGADAIDRSVVDTEFFSLDPTYLAQFSQGMTEYIMRSSDAMKRGERLPPAPNFCEFSGRDCRSSAYLTKEYGNLLNYVKAASFAYFFAHEIGHHILGHLGPGKSLGPTEEDAADRFALQIARKIGRPAIGAEGAFMLFISSEMNAKDHSSIQCRYLAVVTDAVQEMRSDREFMNSLRAKNKMSTFNERTRLIERLANVSATECKR